MHSSIERQTRRFVVVLALTVIACAAFAVLLQPGLVPLEARQIVSSLGLVSSGAFLAASCWRRARVTIGRRRRSWLLMTGGALVAITGNVWAAAVGSSPADSPSAFSDLTIIAALTFCIAAVLGFPSLRRRGVDLLLISLDGLVIGGAVVIIATAVVYDRLLQTGWTLASQFTTLLIPVLDVVLVVVGLLLLLRSRGPDRRALAFLAAGFLSYAVADLAFAVLVARDDFAFGGPLDLGWIIGYALLALAAWYPNTERDLPEGPAATSSVRDTALVYVVLMLAAIVQVSAGTDHRLAAATAALWVVVVIAAAARQIVLTRDNHLLRRGLEQQVREQTADLRHLARQTEVLLTSVGDGIYGVDAHGLVTFVNPSGAAALGHAPDDLHGRNAHDVFHAPDDDGAAYPYDGCYIAEAIRSGIVTNAEEDVYTRADGTTFPVEITASPLVEDDVVRGCVVVFRDVTHRREVDRMKNEFISVVSHELRTPLTSIRGSLGLLASGKLGELSPRARSMATIAYESSERLTRLINDILDLERIESGNRPMDFAPIEAGDLLSRAVTEMAGLARSTGVRVEVAASHGRVQADADRIVQTLTNLINNAIKFSAEGDTVLLDACETDGQVQFRVRDTGRGIPQEKLESIFQRFEQVDSSDARQKGGTGLGLAISRGIVERHGGRIWAESTVGVGTSILFTLPAARRATAVPGNRAHLRPTLARRGTVLLVEDDDHLATVITTLLTGHAVPVARAVGVGEAVRLARELQPRLLVLDIDLSDGTGYDVVAALRTDELTADLDVIVYSAEDVGPSDRPRLVLGRTQFATKGRVDPAGLEDRVLELLQSTPRTPTPTTPEGSTT